MKNIFFVAIILLLCIGVKAQTLLNVETGYVGGRHTDSFADFQLGTLTTDEVLKGYNFTIDVEQSFYKRLGFSLGMEYSKAHANLLQTRSGNIGVGLSLPRSIQICSTENRFALRGGFVFTLLQKKKIAWKFMPCSNLYITDSSSSTPLVLSDGLSFGFTFKNRFQYRYSEDVQFLFSHAFDWTYIFNEDPNRHIFNVGVSYTLD